MIHLCLCPLLRHDVRHLRHTLRGRDRTHLSGHSLAPGGSLSVASIAVVLLPAWLAPANRFKSKTTPSTPSTPCNRGAVCCQQANKLTPTSCNEPQQAAQLHLPLCADLGSGVRDNICVRTTQAWHSSTQHSTASIAQTQHKGLDPQMKLHHISGGAQAAPVEQLQAAAPVQHCLAYAI